MRRSLIVITLLVALLPSACGGSADEGVPDSPAAVEQISGTELNRITLTREAAKRLDVQTAKARSDGKRTVIPYAAVLYDPDGRTWTYTSPKQLVFVREDIRVDRIDGDSAILTAGPSAGTQVVTVGGDELWGVEYGGIEED